MAGLSRDIEHRTDAPADRVVAVVGDLHTFPQWLTIVPRVDDAPWADGDTGPAYFVTLKARLGPINRAKRLRMVRTAHDESGACYQRRELDGRRHSEWRLTVAVEEEPGGGSHVRVTLDYSGGLLEPVIGRLLDDEIDGARGRLDALLSH